MKKFLISTSLVSAFIFSGCSSNHALINFKKDQFNANALQYTKKADIIVKNNPKVLFFATYLNSVEEKFNDNKENFLVGVYFVNEEEQDFIKKGYRVLLNGNEMLEEYTQISSKDEFVKNLPLKNPWAKYYFVKFDKLDTYKLQLKLTNEEKKEFVEEMDESKELAVNNETLVEKKPIFSTLINFEK